jgi:hypothetical protein
MQVLQEKTVEDSLVQTTVLDMEIVMEMYSDPVLVTLDTLDLIAQADCAQLEMIL